MLIVLIETSFFLFRLISFRRLNVRRTLILHINFCAICFRRLLTFKQLQQLTLFLRTIGKTIETLQPLLLLHGYTEFHRRVEDIREFIQRLIRLGCWGALPVIICFKAPKPEFRSIKISRFSPEIHSGAYHQLMEDPHREVHNTRRCLA